MSWYPLGGKGDTDKLLKNPLIEEIANNLYFTSIKSASPSMLIKDISIAR